MYLYHIQTNQPIVWHGKICWHAHTNKYTLRQWKNFEPVSLYDCPTQVYSLPVQFFSHFHMESSQEEDQVDHYTLLPILYNHRFFLNSSENLHDHSGLNRAWFSKPETKILKILAPEQSYFNTDHFLWKITFSLTHAEGFSNLLLKYSASCWQFGGSSKVISDN